MNAYSSHGACKKIQELPTDYIAHNYFDEMQIEFRGQIYLMPSCSTAADFVQSTVAKNIKG